MKGFLPRILTLICAGAMASGAGAVELASSRSSQWDLEVVGPLPGGRTNGFLTRAELFKLPLVTVTNAADGALKKSAAYRGVTLTALRTSLGIADSADVVFGICDDGYSAHFPPDYVAAFTPLLILELDGRGPESWGKSLASGFQMAPFYINSATFAPRPAETVAGQAESVRYPYAVSKLEYVAAAKSIDRLRLDSSAPAEARAGEKIALRDCLSCHGHEGFGGFNSGRPWTLLKTWASNTNYFRRYVVKPKAVQPAARMPGFPHYDDQALDALQAYFRSVVPR
jgi:mono/diheme cytochrome c family protein